MQRSDAAPRTATQPGPNKPVDDTCVIPMPVVLVGHSIGGLTTRLYVGEHPSGVSGVVLLDPTVAAFARMFDDEEFRPRWDGTASADQVDQVTAWPDIPFEILRHDPAVYAPQEIWSAAVEAQWGAEQDAFADLTSDGTVRIVPGSGHNIHEDAPHRPSTRFDGCSMR